MTPTTLDPAAPDTIVLIHGLWMTPRSWEHWIAHYEARGYRVLAPAYPGLEVEVEALRADPSPIAALSIPETVAHYERIIRDLGNPPILMGHSFGGAIVQILLDHGFGAVGVAIDSVPTEGVLVVPPSQIKATFPILNNPANRHRAVAFSPERFHYAFTNTLSDDESLAVYERYAIAAPGSWVWGGVLANFTPGHQSTWVDYKNAARAPLLFVAGGADHIMPASVNRSNAGKYEGSDTITDYHEFPAAPTSPSASPAGKPSPTSPSIGRSPTASREPETPPTRRIGPYLLPDPTVRSATPIGCSHGEFDSAARGDHGVGVADADDT